MTTIMNNSDHRKKNVDQEWIGLFSAFIITITLKKYFVIEFDNLDKMISGDIAVITFYMDWSSSI